MKSQLLSSDRLGYLVILGLVLILAADISPAFAQTNAAAEAVRQRVEGLDRTGGRGAPVPPSRESAPTAEQPPTSPGTSSIDLSYVPSDAAVVAVLRPAKFMASSLGKLLPTEVMSAYGVKQ